jgi:hypothetical protein
VLVIASCQAQAMHDGNVASNARFGVSDAVGAFPTNQDHLWQISGAPAGIYHTPIAVHGVFDVTAGSHTYYFLGDEGSGDILVTNMNLTVVFFPTAYGTVTASAPAEDPGLGAAMSPADLAAERAESEAFSRARIAREVEGLRQEIAALERRLAERRPQEKRGTP